MPRAVQAALSLSLSEVLATGDVKRVQDAYQILHTYLESRNAVPRLYSLRGTPPSPQGRPAKEHRTSRLPRRGGASRASPLPDFLRRRHGSSRDMPE